MYIDTFYNGIELHRDKKIIYGKFLEPHAVISTCRLNGGIRYGLEYVLNHQSCEPRDHYRKNLRRNPDAYMRDICAFHDLTPEKCATMGTAANMHNAAFVNRKFRNIEVVAVITGGVETNAGRAGDPASVFETEQGFERLTKAQKAHTGTINIMIFISQPLTCGALTRTIVTATEAKAAALQELSVNSRYSDGLATGTGTDQIIVAAPIRKGYRLGSAGKHSKLGELIGRTVKSGVKEALARQNRLTPLGQCSSKIHLERFGCSRSSLIEMTAEFLEEDAAKVLRNNFTSIDCDPLTVANVAAAAHIKDKFSWGTLPIQCWKEIMGNCAAQIACSVGGRWDRMAEYRHSLGEYTRDHDNTSFLRLCCKAFALGFSDKWIDGQ